VNGHKAPHAHNIYIDSILSYGIIGTIILLAYIFVLNKEIFVSNTRKENPALFGMMMCFIAIVLVYGLLDCTLNIVATGTLCFIILNSACMYKEK
jgi:O-antigen ligase